MSIDKIFKEFDEKKEKSFTYIAECSDGIEKIINWDNIKEFLKQSLEKYAIEQQIKLLDDIIFNENFGRLFGQGDKLEKRIINIRKTLKEEK